MGTDQSGKQKSGNGKPGGNLEITKPANKEGVQKHKNQRKWDCKAEIAEREKTKAAHESHEWHEFRSPQTGLERGAIFELRFSRPGRLIVLP
jgi:hypothetical protein